MMQRIRFFFWIYFDDSAIQGFMCVITVTSINPPKIAL